MFLRQKICINIHVQVQVELVLQKVEEYHKCSREQNFLAFMKAPSTVNLLHNT